MTEAMWSVESPKTLESATSARFQRRIISGAMPRQSDPMDLTTTFRSQQIGGSDSNWHPFKIQQVQPDTFGQLIDKAVSFTQAAIALPRAKLEMLSRTASLPEEFGQADWDGEGAVAVTRKTIEVAQRFILAMPDEISTADIAADPDGEIAFEWRNTERDILALSIGANGELTFASQVGKARYRGRDVFDSTIPPKILFELRRFAIA